MRPRPNWVAGIFAIVWLAIIVLPIWVLVSASLQTESGYSQSNPLALPQHPTLSSYLLVIDNGFMWTFVNTFIVTVAVAGIVLVLVPPLAFAIVRNQNRTTTLIFRIFLLGLAVPAQAIIVPIFFMISKAGLYDTLIGIILPTAAFALPISTIILTGAMRDITPDLYESMTLDGAGSWRIFRTLVLPLSKGGIATITVFAALQAWNGFLFPLILTQSSNTYVYTLGLYNFQTAYGVNVPALAAAVIISMIPILLVYLFARRYLVQGLMGVGGK